MGYVKERERCSRCYGSGKEEEPCPHCHGTGSSDNTSCYYCSGTGRTQVSCGRCGGSGYVEKDVWQSDSDSSSSSYDSSSSSSSYTPSISGGYSGGRSSSRKTQTSLEAFKLATKALSVMNELDYDEAIRILTEGINNGEIEPQTNASIKLWASFYINRGDCYERKGNMEQAIADWKRSLDIYPENTELSENLAKRGIQYTPQRSTSSSPSASSSTSSRPQSSSYSSSSSAAPAKKGGAVKTVIIATIVLFVLFYGGRFVIGLFSRTKPAAATTQAQPAAAAATITNNVNFRRGPSTSNEIIRQLQQGDAVTLTGETSSGWTQIRHGSDTGWVSSEYLTQAESGLGFPITFMGTWKPETSEWTGGSITFTATKVIISYRDYNLIDASGDVYSVNDGFTTLPLTLKLVNGKLELTEGRYGQMDGTWEKQ